MTEIMNGVWTKGPMRKIVRHAKEFYEDPKNREEFQAWLEQKKAAAAAAEGEESDQPVAAASE